MKKVYTDINSYILNRDQKEFFDLNGFLIIKNVWPKKDIDILRKEIDKVALKENKFQSMLHLHYHNNVKIVHRCKKMCDIADGLLGKNSRAIPIGSNTTFCKPNNPLDLGSLWHQDNLSAKTPDGNNYINIALALDDADSTNGSLSIVKSSHKFGLLKIKKKTIFSRDQSGNMYQKNPIGDGKNLSDFGLSEDLPINQLKYKSGDLVILKGHLLHKADKNRHNSKWRRTIYFVYIKENEPFWPGWSAKFEILDRYDSPKSIDFLKTQNV